MGGHLALALQDVDFYRGLSVGGGGENLALGGRDGGVAVNQAREHAAHGLDAQRQRRHVQQQHVLDLAAQHAALNRRAHGHALVGVDALEGVLARDALDRFLHGGNAGRAAHENDLVNLRRGQAGVLERLLHGLDGRVDQVARQLVELGAGERDIQMARAVGVRGDEGQVDVGAHDAGQLNLGFFGRFLQTLQCHAVLAQVHAVGALELFSNVIDDALVKVVAAQAGVAVGGQHLKDAVADFQQRYVEGAAAQVVHEDFLAAFLIQAVRQRGRRRLVDNAQHFQARDAARILGGLTLAVVEVCGHGDHGLGHLLPQIAFRVRLELLQDKRGDFLRRIGLAVDIDFMGRAHLALDGDDGAVRVGNSLALGDLAYQALAVLGKGHDRRSGTGAFRVGDNRRLAAFHDGDAGVGGAQVDADNLTHDSSSLLIKAEIVCENLYEAAYSAATTRTAAWRIIRFAVR